MIKDIIRIKAFATIFRSLQHRNYKMFFWGQSISLMGTWIQNIAVGWLVYRLTGSAIYLGVVAFAGQIPSLVFTPLAGVYADRFNRRTTLIITQLLAMITAIVLASLVLLDIAGIVHLLVLSVIAGIINAFDNPFRHAFVQELVVNREDLPNAIALNSSLYNTARFIGPLIGGFLISLVGEGWCFMLNGISFIAVIISLIRIQVPAFQPVRKSGSIFSQMADGLRYSWTNKPIRNLLMLIAICGFLGLPFQAFMPVFASDVLHGSATLLGTLTGSLGAGALTGALYLASRRRIAALPKNIIVAAFMFAVALTLFSQSKIILLSMAALYITGFGMIIMFNATNALLQAISEEDKRGRVISFYTLTFMGMTPLGNLLLGTVAEYTSVSITVMITSVCCLTTALLLRNKIVSVEKLL